jgi:hypothetical protein
MVFAQMATHHHFQTFFFTVDILFADTPKEIKYFDYASL